MNHRRSSISATAFPRLGDFCKAYLHQDTTAEYGSGEKALARYLDDADPEEIQGLKEEWKRLNGLAATQSADAVERLRFMQSALRALGAAWMPNTQPELDRLSSLLAL